MQQLTALDSTFWYSESNRTPMHIGSLNIYDPSTAPGGAVGFDDVIDMVEGRLHTARTFRERVVAAPLGLDRPYWVDDPDFDLSFHLRDLALPPPGDWQQLCTQVARLHSRPLDLERPLWEYTVIEGLDAIDGIPAGSFGLVAKIHHCAVDGVSGSEITEATHDLVPDAEAPAADHQWRPAPLPGSRELLSKAGVNAVRRPMQIPRLLSGAVPALRRMRERELHAPPAPGQVPRTRFNGRVSARRVFEARTFSLDEMKAIKNSVPGATVNDVALTVAGGALRRYLAAHDEEPESSLVALAPASLRAPVEMGTQGNLVASMSVDLRTDVIEPGERLAAVHETGQNAKDLTEALGPGVFNNTPQMIPPVAIALAARSYGRISDRVAPVFNCVVSNIPGPQFPLYSAGAELVAYHGMGPVLDGLGLFIAVLSYNGRVSFAITSCHEMMPDPDRFADALEACFDDLRSSTIG